MGKYVRATLVWLPMQAIAIWGEILTLRNAHFGIVSVAVVTLSTLAAIGLVLWASMRWVAAGTARWQPVHLGGFLLGLGLLARVQLLLSSGGSLAMVVSGPAVASLSLLSFFALPIVFWYVRAPSFGPAPVPAAKRQPIDVTDIATVTH